MYRRLKQAVPFIQKGRVLDVGCGPGYLVEVLPDGCRYVGIDSVAGAVNSVRSRGGLAYEADVQSELIPEQPFDSIVSLACIEHLADPSAFLTLYRSLLKDGGVLVLTTPTPAGDRLHRMLQVLRLTSSALKELHESVLSRRQLKALLAESGYVVHRSKLFELGMNQLAVARKSAIPDSGKGS